MQRKILVRFGELSTKGKNKMVFVRKLATNLQRKLAVPVEITYDRLFFEYNPATIAGLKTTFGIQSFSPVDVVATEINAIKAQILEIITQNKHFKTFKISAKRHWKAFPYNSTTLNYDLGAFVLEHSDLTVDLKNPDLKIELEIRAGQSYLFWERINGLGGYPVGVSGKVLLLISGGIDSPVAAYELMKRGFEVDFLSFVTPPHTDQKTLQKVNQIIKHLNHFQTKARLYRSNYTDLMNLIGLTTNQSYKITLMRRSFYRIATQLAFQKHYLAIANGENLGQVASQTIESIHVIQEQTNLPVFRPVLTNDKLETIAKAEQIGTYQLSIQNATEACELFAPKKPVIKPTLQVAYALEKELTQLPQLEAINLKQLEIIDFKNE